MERILVPTDFSPAADNAVKYAVELAKYFSAKLILMNAYPFPPANYEMGFSVPLVSAIKESAEERLKSLGAKICMNEERDLDIGYVAEMGAAYDVIEATARDENVDLVVMGIVGEAGPIKEHLIGSTALTAARKLEAPVFIIPENVKYHRIHKISFACDLDRTEETDLVYVAKYFSKIFDAQLEVVNVEKPDDEMTTDRARTSIFIEKKLELLDHRTVYITGKNVSHELEDYFKMHHTDVVMLNPKKHSLFHSLFHASVTREILFHAKQPILAIH